MRLHPVTLSFVDECASWEVDYRRTAARDNTTNHRLCHVAALFFIGAWAVVDRVFYPEHAATYQLIVFGVLTPVLLVSLGLTFLPGYQRWQQVLFAGDVVVVGGALAVKIALAGHADIQPLFFGIVFTYVFNYAFVRLDFLAATVAGWTVFAAYVAVVIGAGDAIEAKLVQSTLFYGVTLNLLGMMIANAQERRSRRGYVLQRRLARERDTQAELNRQLEESLREIRLLEGILPICASCKKIRDDAGEWATLETYFKTQANVDFTHTVCPGCMAKLYPELRGGR